MFDGFDKLPQFLQLCIGMGCLVGAAYGIYAAIKARKFFKVEDDRDPGYDLRDKLADSRRQIYEKVEELSRRWDVRFDALEDRVRINELTVAEMRGGSKHR